MPVSRQTAEELARQVSEVYAAGEQAMLERIARNLAKGIDGPQWAEQKLAQLRQYHEQMLALITALEQEAATGVRTIMGEAYRRGGLEAVNDLAGMGIPGATVPQLSGAAALQALTAGTIVNLSATSRGILRQVDDLYRSVIAESASQVLTGTETRKQATQRALDAFAKKGITGFVDSAGRGWSLESYAEMATRTGVMNASLQGHMDTLTAHGIDLMIVSADGSPCPLCQPWEGKVVSISGSDPRYPSAAECRAAGWGHPNCVPGDTRVLGSMVRAADSRWYEGKMVILSIASGEQLTITPNHPVLTPEGWIAAGALDEGDSILRYLGQQRVIQTVDPDDEQVPATIEQVFRTLLKTSPVPATSVPVSTEDFHGDGLSGHVDVVFADSFLRNASDALGCKPSPDQLLGNGNIGGVQFSAGGPLTQVRIGTLDTANRPMGGGRQGATLCWRHAREATAHSLASGDAGIAVGSQAGRERSLADTDGFGGLLLSEFPGEIALDRVVKVKLRHFAGHVYNLQTVGGWFACNTIITHNCRHTMSAYQEGITRPYPTKTAATKAAEAERYADGQRLRYIERQIRESKRLEAVAMDPVAQAKARARVRRYQAKARAHVNATGVTRQSSREQIGKAH